MSRSPQSAQPPPRSDAEPSERGDLLDILVEEPALAQLAIVALLGVFALLLWRWAHGRAALARRRRAASDQLTGVELVLAGQPDAALRLLARVLEAESTNSEARLWHAHALLEIGEVATAHREYGKLRSNSVPELAAAAEIGLARALIELGRPAEALESVERARTMAPDAIEVAALRRSIQSAVDGAAESSSAIAGAAIAQLPDSSEVALPIVVPDSGGPVLPVPMLAIPASSLLPVPSASRLADALEANRSHVRRLLGEWAGGDAAAGPALRELGVVAVAGEAVRRAMADTTATKQPWPELLASFGAPVIAELAQVLESELKLRRGGIEMLAGAGRILGTDALNAFADLLEGSDRELRKVAIDHHLECGDVEGFDAVLDACSPLEVLGRLEVADEQLLAALLAKLPAGHVLLDVLLAESTFTRDTVLLQAIARTENPRPLEQLLLRRQPNGLAVRAIVRMLAGPRGASSAARLLDQLGTVARDQIVAVFADLDEPVEVRSEARRRLLAEGPRVVSRLCEGFGKSPGPGDRDLIAVLIELGQDAVDPLVEAYRAGGVLERLRRTFSSRRTHRREVIIRALGHIGGKRAGRALADLGKRETDSDLKLRIRQAEHRVQSGGHADGDGEVRDHVG